MLAEITFAPQASRHSHANEELEALTTFTKHLFNIIIILSIESVHHVVAYPTVNMNMDRWESVSDSLAAGGLRWCGDAESQN